MWCFNRLDDPVTRFAYTLPTAFYGSHRNAGMDNCLPAFKQQQNPRTTDPRSSREIRGEPFPFFYHGLHRSAGINHDADLRARIQECSCRSPVVPAKSVVSPFYFYRGLHRNAGINHDADLRARIQEAAADPRSFP